jgi:hypothetical protein
VNSIATITVVLGSNLSGTIVFTALPGEVSVLQVRNSDNSAYTTVPDATVSMTVSGLVARTDALSLHLDNTFGGGSASLFEVFISPSA